MLQGLIGMVILTVGLSAAVASAAQSLQASVDGLRTPGAVVRVPDGTYTERVTWIGGGGASGRPVILEAEHPGQVIWQVPAGAPEALRIDGVKHAIIRGFVFDGSQGTNSLARSGYTALPVSGAEKLISIGCGDGGCATHITFEDNEFRQSAYGLGWIDGRSSRRDLSRQFHPSPLQGAEL